MPAVARDTKVRVIPPTAKPTFQYNPAPVACMAVRKRLVLEELISPLQPQMDVRRIGMPLDLQILFGMKQKRLALQPAGAKVV